MSSNQREDGRESGRDAHHANVSVSGASQLSTSSVGSGTSNVDRPEREVRSTQTVLERERLRERRSVLVAQRTGQRLASSEGANPNTTRGQPWTLALPEEMRATLTRGVELQRAPTEVESAALANANADRTGRANSVDSGLQARRVETANGDRVPETPDHVQEPTVNAVEERVVETVEGTRAETRDQLELTESGNAMVGTAGFSSTPVDAGSGSSREVLTNRGEEIAHPAGESNPVTPTAVPNVQECFNTIDRAYYGWSGAAGTEGDVDNLGRQDVRRKVRPFRPAADPSDRRYGLRALSWDSSDDDSQRERERRRFAERMGIRTCDRDVDLLLRGRLGEPSHARPDPIPDRRLRLDQLESSTATMPTTREIPTQVGERLPGREADLSSREPAGAESNPLDRGSQRGVKASERVKLPAVWERPSAQPLVDLREYVDNMGNDLGSASGSQPATTPFHPNVTKRPHRRLPQVPTPQSDSPIRNNLDDCPRYASKEELDAMEFRLSRSVRALDHRMSEVEQSLTEQGTLLLRNVESLTQAQNEFEQSVHTSMRQQQSNYDDALECLRVDYAQTKAALQAEQVAVRREAAQQFGALNQSINGMATLMTQLMERVSEPTQRVNAERREPQPAARPGVEAAAAAPCADSSSSSSGHDSGRESPRGYDATSESSDWERVRDHHTRRENPTEVRENSTGRRATSTDFVRRANPTERRENPTEVRANPVGEFADWDNQGEPWENPTGGRRRPAPPRYSAVFPGEEVGLKAGGDALPHPRVHTRDRSTSSERTHYATLGKSNHSHTRNHSPKPKRERAIRFDDDETHVKTRARCEPQQPRDRCVPVDANAGRQAASRAESPTQVGATAGDNSSQPTAVSTVPASASTSTRPPMLGNKLPIDFIGKYSEDKGDKTLENFALKVEMYQRSLNWSDEQTGAAALMCLEGRSFEAIARQGKEHWTWTELKRALQGEHYDQATCAAAQARLSKLKREANTSLKSWGDLVGRVVELAYHDRTREYREEQKVRTYIEGISSTNLEYNLRDKFKDLRKVTLREVISEADTWRVIRQGDRATQAEFGGSTSGKVASVNAPTDNAKKGSGNAAGKAQVPNSKSGGDAASSKNKGKGKNRKSGGKSQRRSGSPDDTDSSQGDQKSNLAKLLKLCSQMKLDYPVQQSRESDQDSGRSRRKPGNTGMKCAGRCWGCGKLGHYRDQCKTQKGRVCLLKPSEENTCVDGETCCRCHCGEHQHFGGSE